ncbi:MAG TPA: DUF2459 domain-containing protein [Stellaceae bacterium]|nr:DUF2459 domain-containing protein [Stellaceae bacterium]
MIRLRRWLWLLALAPVLVGCGTRPIHPIAAAAPGQPVVYALAGGWHTEIALPRAEITGLLAALSPEVGAARYVVFGWGARAYYMATDPGLADVLRAMVPGPAVMLVIPLAGSPAAFAGAANAVAMKLPPDGAERLSRYLWDALAKDANAAPRRIGAGPYPGSAFYAANGSYNLARTCNTWTADALAAAGLGVSTTGVVFASQVMDQLPAPASVEMP